jgi:hypothetical protein
MKKCPASLFIKEMKSNHNEILFHIYSDDNNVINNNNNNKQKKNKSAKKWQKSEPLCVAGRNENGLPFVRTMRLLP